jgi:hypothetical protein
VEHDERPAASNRVEGSVVGQSIQAGVIHGGVHFTVSPSRRPSAGELPDEVMSLLRAQVQAAQDLPRLLPGARRPALADVYVRQDLGSGVEDLRVEPPQPTPILDGHGELVEVPAAPVVRIAVRPPVRTVREAMDGVDHLVVTGGAGQGKSTLSLRLAADIAVRWLDGADDPLTEPVVPLRLTARELAARLDLPFPEALADSVRADYGAFLRLPVSADVLCERVAERRWLLLVDGLDEVADGDDRDRLVKVLASCAAESPYRVVLMTRPIEGAVLAPLHRIGAVRYELQAFDDEALRRFAMSWFADEPDQAERFLRQIRAAHLDDLVRVPLLLTIAAIVFQQRGDRPLPDNQYELYEAYFSFLRSIRPVEGPFEPHRERLLEHLGLVRVETDTSLVAAAREWAHDHVEPAHLPTDWPDQLTAFLVAVGPLVIRGDDLTFLHHSFAEHLAATATARELPVEFAAGHEDFARLLHVARLRERGHYARAVTLHYTRLRPDQADPLLRSLHAGSAEQHLLAARLLAKRIPTTPEVVDAFLQTVRGWAMTTHHMSAEILARACRATQHPGLAAWLAALMRNEGLPWPSRTEAAAALAVRLHGDHLPEAIRFLRAVVDDSHAEVDVRLAAAEALADSGSTERATAERGLRSVLDDEASSGTDLRTAAVLLAAFDREAREAAVAALTRLLDDRDTAPGIVVEAATGLVEIGAEFHERAAKAFRLVLHDRVHSETARGEAALGMASLGPECLAEAAAALTAVINDVRRTRLDRVSAAEVLGQLGPQYRQAAGESVRAMLTEPGIDVSNVRYCATRLAGFGPGFRDEAERRLRAVIDDPGTPVNNVVWALNDLGGLGAEHLPEVARRLWELLDEIRPDTAVYTNALGHLADMGEPHRPAAVERLLAYLADSSMPAMIRCVAANRLTSAGPELHADVARHLLAIAESEDDPTATIDAWRELLKLGHQCHDSALEALLRASRLVDAEPISGFSSAPNFASSEADRDLIADAMASVVADQRKSFRERRSALYGLVCLGPRFHRRAVTEVCALFRSVKTMDFDFRAIGMELAEAGIGLREEVARVLLELLRDPSASVTRIYAILTALEKLGFVDDPAAHAALRTVVECADLSFHRLNAQGMLVAFDPASAPAVADDVFAPEEQVATGVWQITVDQLAHLGVGVLSRLCALIDHPDVERRVRWSSAVYMAKSFPEHRDKAMKELEQHLADIHRRPANRSRNLREFTEVEFAARSRSVEGIAALVGDERLKVTDRCESAYFSVKANRSAGTGVLTLLGRMADNPRLTPAERATAVRWMWGLGVHQDAVRPRLLAAAALDVRTSGQRTTLIGALPRGLRTRVERTLLEDRALLIGDRLPKPDLWDDLPLAGKAETEIREVLTAPEFLPQERVDAALALAQLDIRAVPEVTAYLEGDLSTADRARKALMSLGTERGREVRRDVVRTALDPMLPLRQRRKATDSLLEVVARPPHVLVGVLREIVADPSTSERGRVEALLALGRFDGLAGLRALRDDERTAVSARWLAARKLVEYQLEDRAAAVRVYTAIAADPRGRPALRWRAAKNLADRGQVGRDTAVELLRAMATDTGLPVGARTRAAATLGDIAPNTRGEVLGMLRALLSTDKPLLRRKVLLAIGEVRPEEAALELLAMARDTGHSAVTRVWCAEGAVGLWRDCREGAALVVRAVAADASVARYVRRRAACFLARWSEVCREEARALIREFDRASG